MKFSFSGKPPLSAVAFAALGAQPKFVTVPATPTTPTISAVEARAVANGWDLSSYRDCVARGLKTVLAPLVATKPADAIPEPS